MKRFFTIVVALVLISTAGFSQVTKYSSNTKGRLFGIHFNAVDFVTPVTWKNSSSSRKVANLKDMDFGASLSYWKGLKPKIDLAVKFNAMFHDYSDDRNEPAASRTETGLELEPTINVRVLEDNHFFSPFVTAGLGAGLYTGELGAYVPAGVGLQFNFNSVTYLMLQANYRFTLSKDILKDHLVYSLGFLHNISNQPAAPVVAAPPPPPVVTDRDGDGIPDTDDKCPDVPGVASLMGCPDRDRDGIADADDRCPDVFGTSKYAGCPIPDTDGDGINDEQDKCVSVKGVARYQGCPVPDSDGDGVNDDDDKCRDVPGPADNNGCPKLESLDFKAENVQFMTGSAVLTNDAKKELDKLVKVLNTYPKLNINIDGHTDNVGKPENNLALSKKRAESVEAYLVSKGINGDRLTPEGFGQTKPVADNTTPAGRAKNRRVDFSARQ